MNNEDLLHKYEGKTTGQILKEKRQSLNIDLDLIARFFKIPVEHLAAIENDDEEALPPRVYALGFVKSYASYLNLNEDDMVSLFKMQTVGRQLSEIPSYLDDVQNDSDPNLSKLCLLSFICLVGLVIFYNIFSANAPKEFDTAHLIPTVQNDLNENTFVEDQNIDDTPEAAPESTKERADEALSDDASGKYDVVISAFYDVWMEVKEPNGRIVFSGILKAGKTYKVNEDDQLFLTTGNAGGMNITLNGQKLKLLGDVGQVVRNIPLDKDGLKRYLD